MSGGDVDSPDKRQGCCGSYGPPSLSHCSIWLQTLADTYGVRLLWTLFTSQWILKGFVHAFVTTSTPWLLREYGVPGPKLQIYMSVTMLPWALKPVFGLLSDAFPVLGYNKAPYMILSTVLATLAYSIIAFSPSGSLTAKIIVLCLLCGQCQISICDLLTEAIYAERMREKPERGPDLITFVWTGVTVGSLAATMVIGSALEYLGPSTSFVIILLPVLAMLLPTVFNWQGETKRSPADVQVHRSRLWAQPELLCLVLCVILATAALLCCALLQDSMVVNLSVAFTVFVLMTAAFLMLTKPIIGKMTAFFMLQSACAISVEGGAFYFYTNGPKEYPEGPHFSMFFYTTVIGVCVGVCNLAGMASYQLWFKTWRYHSLFIGGNIMLTVIHLVSILVFTRSNLAIGIPDTVFVLGTSMINSVVSQWVWIPGIVMLSHLCPKNLEATMYALLAGCMNFGNNVASFIGAGILLMLGVTPDGSPGESRKFDNLWLAALISAAAPIIVLFAVPYMLPNATQTEPLLDDQSSAVEGSPWQKLRKSWGMEVDGEAEATPLKTAEEGVVPATDRPM